MSLFSKMGDKGEEGGVKKSQKGVISFMDGLKQPLKLYQNVNKQQFKEV